jgi:hypothetical protein
MFGSSLDLLHPAIIGYRVKIRRARALDKMGAITAGRRRFAIMRYWRAFVLSE